MHPFVRIMQRYIDDYCNRHDMSVCQEIMAPDYVVHIAGRELAGRDNRYVPAASAAFEAFPDLRLTVHEVHTNGDCLVMRFSERGTSAATGRVAAWGGIGLYAWDGTRLVSNWVEQDYAARQRQIDGVDAAHPLDAPAPDPWAAEPVPADVVAVDAALGFLLTGDLLGAPDVVIDDSWITGVPTLPLQPTDVELHSVIGCGPVVAAHVGLSDGARRLNVAVILRIDAHRVVSVRAVTDRLSLVS